MEFLVVGPGANLSTGTIYESDALLGAIGESVSRQDRGSA